MQFLLRLSRGMDAISDWVGRILIWALFATVIVSAANAIVRKVFSVGSNAWLEVQWYLFAAVFLLGAGYAFLHNAHVRIDFISGRLSARTRNIIDIVGIVAFLAPLAWILLQLSWPLFVNAWQSGEMSQNAGGLIRWPVLALVPLGMVLLLGPGRVRTGQARRVPQGTDSRPAGASGDAAVAGHRRGTGGGGAQMSQFIAANFVPLLFGGLLVFLLTGFPVAFSLAATGLAFGFIGMEIGLFPATLFQALPLRVQGIMQNDTLLAVPFFTLMGIILEKSGMAEDLLETVGQVFGPIRGGLALAVIFVGALLAATTGVVAAAVISMGLISLPIMLRYGYNRTIATGVITASGTLAQAIPPSLVLIVLADQLGRSVGDMYAGAILPALLLVGCYALYVVVISIIKPSWAPALPAEARIYREANGASGHKSLLVLLAIATAAGFAWAQVHERVDQSAGGAPAAGARRRSADPVDDDRLVHGPGPRAAQPAVPAEPRVEAVGARDLRADPAARADLPRARHDLPRRGHAHRRRRDGRRRRAADGGRQPPPVDVAAEAGAGEHDAAVVLRDVHPDRLDGVQLHVQRGRRPHLRRVAVQGHAGRGARVPHHRQRPDLHPRLLHRLLRDRVHRDPAAGAGRGQDPPGTAAGRHAGPLGADLVRRHRGDEPADVLPHAALRLRAVLPAQRGAAARLSRSRHRQEDRRRVDDRDLQGRPGVHRHPALHGRDGHRLPGTRGRRQPDGAGRPRQDPARGRAGRIRRTASPRAPDRSRRPTARRPRSRAQGADSAPAERAGAGGSDGGRAARAAERRRRRSSGRRRTKEKRAAIAARFVRDAVARPAPTASATA